MKCPGSTPQCQRNRWDFEDGTTQEFSRRTDIADIQETAVLNSTARAHTGTHSLALPLKAGGGIIDIDLSHCIDEDIWLPSAGRSISAWFYIDGPVNASPSNYLSAGVWGCANSADGSSINCVISNVSNTTLPLNTWFQIVSPVPDSFAASWPMAEAFSIEGDLITPGSTTVLYVDDISFQ
jgi:hypothetical protein